MGRGRRRLSSISRGVGVTLTTLVALALAIVGEAASAGTGGDDGLEVAFGEHGPSVLRFGGEQILAKPRPRVRRALFRDGRAVKGPEPKRISFNRDQARLTLRYPWGVVVCRYRVHGRQLKMRVEVRNTAERPLEALEVAVMAFRLEGLASTGMARSNAGGPAVVPVRWRNGTMVFCRGGLGPPLRLAIRTLGGNRAAACLSMGKAGGDRAGRRSPMERPIPPGQSDRYRVSFRFGGPAADPLELASDLYQRYRAERGSPAVTAIAFDDGGVDRGLTDMILSELSSLEGFRVVDRTEIKRLLREQGRLALSRSDRLRLGRIVGARYLVLLSGGAQQNPARVTIVDARSGRELERSIVPHASGGAAELVSAVARAAEKAITGNQASRGMPDAPAVALLPARSALEESARLKRARRTIDRIAENLRKSAPIVYRIRPSPIAREHRLQEGGFARGPGKLLPLLGARFLVRFRVAAREHGRTLVTQVVDTQAATRLASWSRSFEDESPRAAGGVLASRIKTAIRRADDQPVSSPASNEKSLSPEAAAVFYRAVALHNRGRYTEALRKLDVFGNLAPRSFAHLRWRQSCYRELGYGPVARAHDEVIDKDKHLLSRLPARSGPGLAAVSVRGEGPSRGRLTATLTRALSDVSGTPVLVSRDLAALQQEYDFLVGHESTRGTSWRWAPKLLASRLITADWIGRGDKARLRLYRVPTTKPDKGGGIEVRLSTDTGWKKRLQDAVRRLLQEGTEGIGFLDPRPYRPRSQRPRHPFHASSLWKRIRPESEDAEVARFLDAARLNPKIALKRRPLHFYSPPLDDAFTRWIHQAMPNPGPQSTGAALFRYYRETIPREMSVEKYRSWHRDFAAAHPDTLMGTLAEYRKLIVSLDLKRLKAQQKMVEGLIQRVKRLQHKWPAFDEERLIFSMRVLRDFLRFAQGGAPPEVKGPKFQAWADRDATDLRAVSPEPSGELRGIFRDPAAARMQIALTSSFPATMEYLGDLPESRVLRFRETVEDRVDTPLAMAYAMTARPASYYMCSADVLRAIPEEDAAWIIDHYQEAVRFLIAGIEKGGRVNWHGLFCTWYPVKEWLENHRRTHERLLTRHESLRARIIKLLSREEPPWDRRDWHTVAGFLRLRNSAKGRSIIREKMDAAWRLPPSQRGKWPEPEWRPGYTWRSMKRGLVRRPPDERHFAPIRRYVDKLLDRFHPSKAPDRVSPDHLGLFVLFGLNLMKLEAYGKAEKVVNRTLRWLEPWKKAENKPIADRSRACVFHWKALLEHRRGNVASALQFAKRAMELAEPDEHVPQTIGIDGGEGGSLGKLYALLDDLMTRLRREGEDGFKNPYAYSQ